MASRGFLNFVARFRKPRAVNRPPNTVILHQFFPIGGIPSGSPPCLKLETFLRMSKIPYVNSYGVEFSKKGKIPWISYNNTDIADSNFCIDFLRKEFKVDLDEGLTDKQRGASLAIRRMCDENTYWGLVHHRWNDEFEKTRKFFKISKIDFLDKLICKVIRNRVRAQLVGHGIGLHSGDELYFLVNQDIKALSGYLGNNKFFMGEKASLVDASVFGIMASLLLVDTASPMNQMIKENCTNIEDFCNRMKDTFWPDWDSVVSKKKMNSKL